MPRASRPAQQLFALLALLSPLDQVPESFVSTIHMAGASRPLHPCQLPLFDPPPGISHFPVAPFLSTLTSLPCLIRMARPAPFQSLPTSFPTHQ